MVTVPPSVSFHYVTSSNGIVTRLTDARNSTAPGERRVFRLPSEFFDYLQQGEELVDGPFHRLMEKEQLLAYDHDGFWRAMDTFKDKEHLDACSLCLGSAALADMGFVSARARRRRPTGGDAASSSRVIRASREAGSPSGWRSLGCDVTGYALAPPTTPSLFEEASVGDRSAVELRRTSATIRGSPRRDGVPARRRDSHGGAVGREARLRRSHRDVLVERDGNGQPARGRSPARERMRCRERDERQVLCHRESGDAYIEKRIRWVVTIHTPTRKAARSSSRRRFADPSFARVDREHGVLLASARAGNAIGGGDWTPDQLIPDLVRGFHVGTSLPDSEPGRHPAVAIRARATAGISQVRRATRARRAAPRVGLELRAGRRRREAGVVDRRSSERDMGRRRDVVAGRARTSARAGFSDSTRRRRRRRSAGAPLFRSPRRLIGSWNGTAHGQRTPTLGPHADNQISNYEQLVAD